MATARAHFPLPTSGCWFSDDADLRVHLQVVRSRVRDAGARDQDTRVRAVWKERSGSPLFVAQCLVRDDTWEGDAGGEEARQETGRRARAGTDQLREEPRLDASRIVRSVVLY